MGWFTEKSDVGQLHALRSIRSGEQQQLGELRIPGLQAQSTRLGDGALSRCQARCFRLKIQGEGRPEHVFHELLTQWRKGTSTHISIKLVVNTLRQRQSNVGTQRRPSPAGGGNRERLRGRGAGGPQKLCLKGGRSGQAKMSLLPPPTSPSAHTGTWPGTWTRFGLCLQLLAPPRYACVGVGLLFKVLTGRVTRKGHGPLPATG